MVYLITGDRPAVLAGAVALLYALFMADREACSTTGRWADFVSIGEALGTHAAITVGGILLTVIVPAAGHDRRRQRLLTALALGGAFALAAILLRRPWGINKNNATPAWGLWASAVTCWLWALFHVINDVRGWTLGWGFMRDLGRNALLAYLIAPLFASLLELTGINAYGDLGDKTVVGIIPLTGAGDGHHGDRSPAVSVVGCGRRSRVLKKNHGHAFRWRADRMTVYGGRGSWLVVGVEFGYRCATDAVAGLSPGSALAIGPAGAEARAITASTSRTTSINHCFVSDVIGHLLAATLSAMVSQADCHRRFRSSCRRAT
jgi:hypothetical protein